MAVDLAVQTDSLTKQFDRHIAVRDLDLDIAAGEVYGLIGPNGAGKTTLIRMLACAEEPTVGTIAIHGQVLRADRPQPELKRRIGYLPDDYPLYNDLSVWDYLDYFARLYGLRNPHRDRRIHAVLDLVSLSHKRTSKITTLSRGMKQRLGLARTIIHEPTLLLLDEPVSGLDPIARQHFRDVIKALRSVGMTILISSHVLSDLQELCSSVGIMEFGFLVESARLEDLYQRLCQPFIDIGVIGDRAPLLAELQHYPQVQGIENHPEQPTLRVEFRGSEAEAAELLRSLLAANIKLYNFHYAFDDLESVFMKLGHQQAT